MYYSFQTIIWISLTLYSKYGRSWRLVLLANEIYISLIVLLYWVVSDVSSLVGFVHYTRFFLYINFLTTKIFVHSKSNHSLLSLKSSGVYFLHIFLVCCVLDIVLSPSLELFWQTPSYSFESLVVVLLSSSISSGLLITLVWM